MIAILSIIFCINYKYMKNYKFEFIKYTIKKLDLNKNLKGGHSNKTLNFTNESKNYLCSDEKDIYFFNNATEKFLAVFNSDNKLQNVQKMNSNYILKNNKKYEIRSCKIQQKELDETKKQKELEEEARKREEARKLEEEARKREEEEARKREELETKKREEEARKREEEERKQKELERKQEEIDNQIAAEEEARKREEEEARKREEEKKLEENKIIKQFNTSLIEFISLSQTKPANYWQYYLNNPGTVLDLYEKYSKDHPNTYKDQNFMLVTNQQINDLVPSCNNLYQRLTPELRTENRENYILKYTLPDNSKIAYFGDYHSSLHSLIECIENLRIQDFFESGENNFKLKENRYLVFLGDLVDRGPYGIECLYLLYLLFLINNQTEYRVFILNGNHEEKSVYTDYAFASELKYQFKNDRKTIDLFEDLIKYLPLALFLRKGTSKWYQFCHGGIDESQKNDELKSFLANDTKFHVITTPEFKRGFLFSDFTSKDGRSRSQFGRGWVYTREDVDRITNDNNIMTIISGHQDMINYGVILRPLEDNYKKYVWDDDMYKESESVSLKTLKVIQDDSNKDTPNGGTAEIDMNDVSATIISSSTIAKLLKFSIYGILDLSNDRSTIIWFPSCNTKYLEKRGREPVLCNKHLL